MQELGKVVGLWKAPAAPDEDGLERFLHRLLGIEAQVLEEHVGQAPVGAAPREVAPRVPEPFGGIARVPKLRRHR
jgi:hypothetical protein